MTRSVSTQNGIEPAILALARLQTEGWTYIRA